MNKQAGLQASLFLFCAVLTGLGVFYGITAPDFGKQIVGSWAFAALPLALLTLIGACACRKGMIEICSLVSILIQLLPAVCWLFLRPGFSVFGIFIPSNVGGAVHIAIIVWSFIHYKLASQVFD